MSAYERRANSFYTDLLIQVRHIGWLKLYKPNTLDPTNVHICSKICMVCDALLIMFAIPSLHALRLFADIATDKQNNRTVHGHIAQFRPTPPPHPLSLVGLVEPFARFNVRCKHAGKTWTTNARAGLSLSGGAAQSGGVGTTPKWVCCCTSCGDCTTHMPVSYHSEHIVYKLCVRNMRSSIRCAPRRYVKPRSTGNG